MKRISLRHIAALVALSAMSACSSPNPTLYTLSVAPGSPLRGGPAVVSVRDVSIARYLERPQIVRSIDGNRIDVRSNEWWGEPLAAMFGRVLIEELSQRLPDSVVIQESSAVVAKSDATVAVSLDRMDAAGPEAVALVARVAVTFTKSVSAPLPRTVRLQVPASTTDTVQEVAGMSVAFGQLADSIAQQLHAGR